MKIANPRLPKSTAYLAAVLTSLMLIVCGASMLFVSDAFADPENGSVSIAPGEKYTYTPELENELEITLSIKYQGFEVNSTDGEFAEIIDDSLVVIIPESIVDDTTYYVTLTITSGIPVQIIDIPIIFAISIPETPVDPDPVDPDPVDPDPVDPDPVDPDPVDPDGAKLVISSASVVLIVVALLSGTVAAATRRPILAIFTVVLLAVVIFNQIGTFTLPDIPGVSEIKFRW